VHKSLESQLKAFAVGISLLVFVFVCWVLFLLDASKLISVTLIAVVGVPLAIFFVRFYQRIISPFYRLTSMVEAVRLEDYSLRARPLCSSGIIHNLSDEINALSTVLQQRKQRYDQDAFVLYQLIEQLDTPIVVFNDRLQLSHANEAFSIWCNQPWLTLKHTLSAKLGLVLNDQGQWQLKKQSNQTNWQLRQSNFIQGDEKYHLLVLTDIEKEIRKTQQDSWLQIIRVLSHEIHNSLTPIKSLAQSMAEMPVTEPRSKAALEVIVNRSETLQEFVNRYAKIYRNFNVKGSRLKSAEFSDKLGTLFNNNNIIIEDNLTQFFADPVLLEQVMINLIKNAIEASASEAEIKVSFNQIQQKVHICIIDSGSGIANPDNLFVPFFTTKETGSGIGLALCRNIIEQHGGSLDLVNNESGLGATAKIVLPNENFIEVK